MCTVGKICCLLFCHFPRADCFLPADFSLHCSGNVIKIHHADVSRHRGPIRASDGTISRRQVADQRADGLICARVAQRANFNVTELF